MKTLLLIDANSLIHRCFHALPALNSPKKMATNALYGLSSILLKILKQEKPDFIAAAFDRPEPSFRKKLYKEYKIQRPKPPKELVSQIIESRKLLEKFKIKFFEKPGFEADDILGSLVKKFKKEKDLRIIILTGDLDILQLVKNEKIMVKTFKKGISETFVYNQKAVEQRFNLLPEQLPDFKALVGDASDNIKGVPGIGKKTAAVLLNKYYDLENLFQNIDASQKQKLSEFKEQAFFSKKLTLIEQDIDLKVNLNDLSCKEPDSVLKKYFETLGFKTLISRLNNGQQTTLDMEHASWNTEHRIWNF